MKKLLLLLLVFTGMVSTASADAITIYVANDAAWAGMYLHEWGGITGTTWPGTVQPLSKIINGKWYFKVTISGENFTLNSGNGQQTEDQTTSNFTDGNYYSNEDNKLTAISAPTAATYTYNFSVTACETIYNLYLYKGDTKYAGNWPGAYITAEDGVYNFTYGSSENLGELKVVFKGTDPKQTCDLWANPGDNNYNIASLASSQLNSSWGEGVKMNSDGYSTYVTYNPLDIPTGIAYYATDLGTGSAQAINTTHPAAKTPLLLKGVANTIYHFAPKADGTDYSSTNAFKQGKNTNVAEGTGPYNYILKGDQFYLANGNYVAENKAYLQLSVAASASPLIFEDEISGINAITTVKAENGAYYNLQGVKVANPGKGLYIRNGKKFIVK